MMIKQGSILNKSRYFLECECCTTWYDYTSLLLWIITG